MLQAPDRLTPSSNPTQGDLCFRNPINAIYSFFRRKTTTWSPTNSSNHRHLEPIPEEMPLGDFAAHGVIAYSSHTSGIGTRFYQYPILFIRYEKIWDNLEPLLDFAGVPQSETDQFPEKKGVEIKLEEIVEQTQADMRKIYGEFHDYLEGTGLLGSEEELGFPHGLCAEFCAQWPCGGWKSG